MQSASKQRGFTLIELLTVIAIIAVLAAILFPVAGTVREQARASDCMTKLHQLWVSANVYKQDEGVFPGALMGYAETLDTTDATQTRTVFLTDPTAQTPVNADRILMGFLYGEQIRDINLFRCPDNANSTKNQVTVAYFPPRPADWPVNPNDPRSPRGYYYVADVLANNPCPADAFGTVDCWREPEVSKTDPLYGKPKFFYVWNSYDIGPRVGVDGHEVKDSGGNVIYDRHYSTDWTGDSGLYDLPNQLKYANPPDDKTLLAYCSWHAAIAGANSAPAITMAGTAKKIDLPAVQKNGANLFNR